MEPRYEKETFLNGGVTLGEKTFMDSLDCFHLEHKKRPHTYVNPLYAADFQQRPTISICRCPMSHLQAYGHEICTIKESKPSVLKLEASGATENDLDSKIIPRSTVHSTD